MTIRKIGGITIDADTLDGKAPGAANGLATLGAGSLVVENPATSYILSAEKAAASGVASLNAGSLVVQNPATAYIPTAQKGAASGVASLDAGSVVEQSPLLHEGDHVVGGRDDIDSALASVAVAAPAVAAINAAGLTLADGKNVKIEEALGTDDTWAGIVCDGVAGEEVTVGQICYRKAADSKFWKTDADAAATMPAVAMATATIAADATGVFLLIGYLRHDAWTWTVGSILFADETTAGAMDHTAPAGAGDQVQVVGYALTADIVYFNPCLEVVEIT